MTPQQLRRRIRDLENLKKKNKNTIEDLKKNCKDLQKNLTEKEKECVRIKKASERDLSEISGNHANQIKAMKELHLKEKKEKSTIIRDQAEKLQDLRKTNNLVSFNFLSIKFHFVVVF